MLTKKKVTIAIILVFIGLGLFFLFRLSPIGNEEFSDQPKDTQDYSNLPKISPPGIEQPFASTIDNIQIDIRIPTLAIPNNLPLYELDQSALTESEIQTIASNLGFKGSVTKSQDYTGSTIYSYYESSSIGSSKNLDVIAEQRTINYVSGILPEKNIPFAPSKDTVSQIIKSFLTKNGLVSNADSYEVTTVQLQAVSPEGHTQDAYRSSNLVNVSLTQRVENLPVLGASNINGSIRASLNGNSEIVSLEIESLPELTKGSSYPLKNTDEIISTIDQATIQDIGDGRYDITNLLRNTVGRITITSASLGYLKEANPDQKYLQPVFILKGTAYFTNGGTTSATLYLPAFSQSSFEE